MLPCSDTWRRWLKAPFRCCHPTMITAFTGQRRPLSRFTCWRCWTSRRRGLKSGWCALSPCWPHQPHSLLFFDSLFLFSLVSSSAQHGYYSRTVVLRLLERKYKSLVSDSVGDRYASPALFVLGTSRQLRSQNKDWESLAAKCLESCRIWHLNLASYKAVMSHSGPNFSKIVLFIQVKWVWFDRLIVRSMGLRDWAKGVGSAFDV